MTVLSIGMIVKNEEKRLCTTLEALQPLRDAIDCQLIIADTGSNDRTIEIAKEFADIFLQIEWENDFAKARNATLAKADGTWFFYLDADEVLTDPEEMIEFFSKPKQWQTYASMVIKIRNVVSEKRNILQDFSSARLFQIERGTWFIGTIHELYPQKTPVYELKQSYLFHYGYNNDDTEFMQQKGQRNLAIMDAMMKNEELPAGSHGAKLWFDYAGSMMLVEERISEVEKNIRKGLALLKPLEDDDTLKTIMLARGYSIMIRAAYSMHEDEKCLAIGKEYFALQPKRGLWDSDVYCILGWAYMRLEEYEAAVKNMEIYLEIESKEKPQTLQQLIAFGCDGMENQVRFFLTQSYFKLHDYDKAWRYVGKIEGNIVEGVDITAYKWQMALNNNSENRIPLLYAELTEDNRLTILLSLADAICKKNSLSQQDIAAGLRQIVADDEEALLPLLALATNDAEELRSCLHQMGSNKFTTAQGGIIRQCLRSLVPMDELLPHLDKNSIVDYISTCQAYYNDWLNWAASYYDAFDVKNMPLSELWMARYLLCTGIAEENTETTLHLTILPMLLRYAGKYLQQVYNPIMLTEQIDLLPAAEQFVIYAQRAEDALAQQNYTQAIQALREALRVYPSTQAVIKRKLAEIEELADPIGAEMKRLAATVKQQIRTLIDDGLLTDAASLIDELSAIVPDDPDIPYLLEQTQPPDIIWN